MKALASRLPRPSAPSGWMPIVSDGVVWALLSGMVLVGLLDPGQLSPSFAFMTAGAVSSIPAALAVYALVRPPVFVLYILLGFTGSVIAGLAYTLLV